MRGHIRFACTCIIFRVRGVIVRMPYLPSRKVHWPNSICLPAQWVQPVRSSQEHWLYKLQETSLSDLHWGTAHNKELGSWAENMYAAYLSTGVHFLKIRSDKNKNMFRKCCDILHCHGNDVESLFDIRWRQHTTCHPRWSRFDRYKCNCLEC